MLTCPPAAITLSAQPPAGRLAGLTCYAAGSSSGVLLGATPQRNVQVRPSRTMLSIGAESPRCAAMARWACLWAHACHASSLMAADIQAQPDAPCCRRQ